MSALIPAKIVANELPTPTTGALASLVVAGGDDVFCAACVAITGRAWPCCAALGGLAERCVRVRVCVGSAAWARPVAAAAVPDVCCDDGGVGVRVRV